MLFPVKMQVSLKRAVQFLMSFLSLRLAHSDLSSFVYMLRCFCTSVDHPPPRQCILNKLVFSIQPHPTYLSILKYIGWSCLLNCFLAIIPTLFLYFLLICYPYIALHFNVFLFLSSYMRATFPTPMASWSEDLCSLFPGPRHFQLHEEQKVAQTWG